MITEARLLELYLQQYYHELDQRSRFATATPFPLAIVVLFVPVILRLAQKLHGSPEVESILFWMLLLSVCVASITVTVGVLLLIRSFYGHGFETIPNAQDFQETISSLTDYFEAYPTAKSSPDRNPRSCALESVATDLLDRLASAVSVNQNINRRRAEYRHHCFGWLIASVVPIATGSLAYAML